MHRRFVSAAALAAFVGGCSFNQPVPRGDLTDPAAGPATAPVAATQPAESETAKAMTKKTAAYAQVIEEYMAQRNRPKIVAPATQESHATPALAVATPAAYVPEVKWVEPKPVELALGPKQARDEYPRQSETASPAPESANQGARVEPVAVVRPAAAEQVLPPGFKPLPTSDQLESKLAKQVKEYPRDLGAQLDYQLLQMIRGKSVPQLDSISGLPAEDREAISALLDALSNFRNTARADENTMLARKLRPLVELSDRLRSQASLRISTVALCTRVDGFGVYEPLASSRLLAGKEHAVILYCEVENFLSQLNDRQMWETNLTQEVVLYNDRGQRVWEDKRRPVNDVARNLRHDFFVVRMLRLPATLAPGRYILKVTISDLKASRVTEASAGVEIVTEK